MWALAVLIGLRDLFRKGPALTVRSSVDGAFYMELQVCRQLVKHGIALDKPVHSLFYLYFPTRPGADVAAAARAERGPTITVREPWQEAETNVEDFTVIAGSRTRS